MVNIFYRLSASSCIVGAGKTTLLECLAGIHPPTSGTAIIDGMDISTSIDKVRQSLGVCPQFDALIEELTVLQMLLLFSKLKGMTSHDAMNDAERVMNSLEVSGGRKIVS